MCAAVLGQCGPRVPSFKSLFHSQRYSDEVSFLRGDRQAELQSIWQEIGEDKCAKLEEVRQMIIAAADQIYERALEEGVRRKLSLQEMVSKSENRLKEYLRSTAIQVMASKELPLQTRLNMNMARLQDLDNARLGGYGWVGGLVVLVELRHRVAVLREMLRLPPCDTFADLDEILASTTEALHNLCPGQAQTTSCLTFHPLKNEQRPIFHRLQRFYQTLCAMEDICLDSFPSKQDTSKGFKDLHCSEASAQMRLQELEFKEIKDRNLDLDRYIDERSGIHSTNPMSSFGFAKKRSTSKFGQKTKDTSKKAKQNSEDALKLEQLSQKILKKLEDINRHVVCATKSVDTTFSPLLSYSQISDTEYSPSSGMANILSKNSSVSAQSASMSPSSSEDNGGSTPTSVLPDTASATSYQLSTGINPMHRRDSSITSLKRTETPLMLLHDQGDQTESIDACWAEQYENDLAEGQQPIKQAVNKARQVYVAKVVSSETFMATCRASDENARQNDARQNDAHLDELQDKVCLVVEDKESTISVMYGHTSTPLPIKTSKPLPVALPPPQLSQTPSIPTPNLTPTPCPAPSAPAPPPPPPPPPSLGTKRLQTFKSSKLKKSSTISRLYMGMKKKVDGAEYGQSPLADGAIHRRSIAVASSRDGMAEALAEITRRSAYFKKIEDDVQKHAASVMEIKSGLESFETRDMQKLLRFHESIEARLEQLTDESQVLARFEGFPIKKLEAVRAAASLYLRMSSLAHHIENWTVEPPMSEHLDKITSFFDKVKTDVEVIERTKDEDIIRFQSQKIFMSFDTIVRIKESIVSLSSRSLALAMKESQRSKGSITIGDEYLSTKDMNKLRGSFHMLWRVFQLAFRAHNFAGGHDDKAEQLCCNLAKEMDTYPSSFWLELVNK